MAKPRFKDGYEFCAALLRQEQAKGSPLLKKKVCRFMSADGRRPYITSDGRMTIGRKGASFRLGEALQIFAWYQADPSQHYARCEPLGSGGTSRLQLVRLEWTTLEEFLRDPY